MKQKMKTIKKIFIFGIIFVLISCEKEFLEDNIQKNKITH